MPRQALHVLATVALAVGFVVTASAAIFNDQAPTEGANIGAGILFLLGVVVGSIGLVVAVVSLFVGRRRAEPA